MSASTVDLHRLRPWADQTKHALRAEYGDGIKGDITVHLQQLARVQLGVILTPEDAQQLAQGPPADRQTMLDLITRVFHAHCGRDCFTAVIEASGALKERLGISLHLWELTEIADSMGIINGDEFIDQCRQRRDVLEREYELSHRLRLAYPRYFTQPLSLFRLTGLPIPNLSNPIHPIFRRKNFDPEIDYDSIKPALHLASHMLTAKRMRSFWWLSMLSKEDSNDWLLGTPPGSKVNVRNVGRLTASQVQTVRERLKVLASCITFKEDTSLSGAECGRKRGPRGKAPSPFKGVCCIIRFSFKFLAHAASPNGELQGYSALVASLLLAITLLHETAHAAVFAARSHSNLYFLGDAATSEEGYESEKRLFGGIVDGIFGAHELAHLPPEVQPLPDGRIRAFCEWPFEDTLRMAREKGYRLSLQRGHKKFVSKRLYPILNPRHWVYSLFTEELWQRVETDGTVALRPSTYHCFWEIGIDAEGNTEFRGPFQ